MSNLNHVTLRQDIFYMVQFELPNYFCVIRCFKIYRIHGQLQSILGNTVFIQGGIVSREKIRGSNMM